MKYSQILSSFLVYFAAFARASIFGIFAPKRIGNLVAVDDTAFFSLIDANAKIEILADGLEWSEGPVWVKSGNYVLFSDPPKNTIYKWSEQTGLEKFLTPSGYTGRGTYGSEVGSNGLIINDEGKLVACEHGDRRITVMPLDAGGKFTLADSYEGKRLNSPNDIVQKSNGDYYFTDPPYGLPNKGVNDTLQELSVCGVYRVKKDRNISLVASDLARPNGLAFSPDEKILYVSQSDPVNPIIMSYPVLDDGTLGTGKVFFNSSDLLTQGLKGLPDGLVTDIKGNVFATVPGGISVISPDGKLLGRIDTGQATSNVAWGEDGSVLYITADMYLCRIKTKTIGANF